MKVLCKIIEIKIPCIFTGGGGYGRLDLYPGSKISMLLLGFQAGPNECLAPPPFERRKIMPQPGYIPVYDFVKTGT